MASITISNLDDTVKARLRARAKANNRSMTEEARIILREAVKEEISDAEPKKETRTFSEIMNEILGPERYPEFRLPSRRSLTGFADED